MNAFGVLSDDSLSPDVPGKGSEFVEEISGEEDGIASSPPVDWNHDSNP